MPRRGRKMGHVTVLGDDVDQVAESALRLRGACVAKPNAVGVRRSATMR
jgi:phosphoribosylaminoimidazole carboxylase (NCAIR synthetase)